MLKLIIQSNVRTLQRDSYIRATRFRSQRMETVQVESIVSCFFNTDIIRNYNVLLCTCDMFCLSLLLSTRTFFA